MKMVEIKRKLMKDARHACYAAINEEPYWDLDWVESKVSDIVWRNVLWPLQGEIEDERL